MNTQAASTNMRTGKGGFALAAAVWLAAGTALAVTETTVSGADLASPGGPARGSARVAAMDATYVAVAEGASALGWNPAGLGSLPAGEIGLHHQSGIQGTVTESLVAGLPLGKLGGLAVSFDYLDAGSIEGRDATGDPNGHYRAGSVGGSLGWGLALPMNLEAGVTVRGVQQTLADMVYSSFAADLGVLYQATPAIRVGLAYANLGSSGSANTLASALRAGGSYVLELNRDNRLLGAAAVEVVPGGGSALNLGAEDTLFSRYAVRAGYRLNFTDQKLTGLTGLTAGLGIVFSSFSLDYAFLPYGELGSSQQVSLTYRGSRSPERQAEPANGGAQ